MAETRIDADLLAQLRPVALEAATGAARVVRQYAGSVLTDVRTKSSPTDLVSEADRASEQFIFSYIRRHRPDDSVRGEEGASHEGSSGITWVADPLDGTTNFVFGLPAYAVSLAARLQGRAVAGVVVDCSRDEVWTAWAGQGAYCNGAPCTVASGRSVLATALVATGFGYQRERRLAQASVAARVLGEVRDVRRFGSAALDLCWVAAGRYDAYYEAGLSDWDWAAGRLVCEEAGGTVSMLGTGELLASTPELHAPLSEVLRRAHGQAAPPAEGRAASPALPGAS